MELKRVKLSHGRRSLWETKVIEYVKVSKIFPVDAINSVADDKQ